jgi:hypothetical protein
VIAAAAAGRAAAQGPPKPERSPSSGQSTIHPEAAPSARAQQKSFSSDQGSSTSSYIALPTQNSRTTVTFPTTPARPHARVSKTPVHRTAKKDPPVRPVRLPTKPVASIAATGGEILTTSAHGLTKAPSSSESLLLLLVGLALVVLVVGETTFLRLAARGPAPRRTAEEPLPIRRVQLRR